jgi:hypothetical protein
VHFGNGIGWIHYLPNERPMSELAPVPPLAADSSISDTQERPDFVVNMLNNFFGGANAKK